MFHTKADRLLAGLVGGGLAFLGFAELLTRLSELGPLVYWLPTLWGGSVLVLVGSFRRGMSRRTSQALIIAGVVLGLSPSIWTLVMPALSIALVFRSLTASELPAST